MLRDLPATRPTSDQLLLAAVDLGDVVITETGDCIELDRRTSRMRTVTARMEQLRREGLVTYLRGRWWLTDAGRTALVAQ